MSKLIWKIHDKSGRVVAAARNKFLAARLLSYYDEGTIRYKRRIVYRRAPGVRMYDESLQTRVVARIFGNAVAVESDEPVNLKPIALADPTYYEEEDEE